MEADAELVEWLRAAGLAEADETPPIAPLSGGVSSDVLRVDLRRGSVCVKRALARLKVASDWRAPVVRSDYEVAWFRAVGSLGGPIVPEVVAADPAASRFAMTWFPPDRYRVWKAQLVAGHMSVEFAGQVGAALVRVHAGTAGRADIAAAFATDELFESLRIEPYLRHTASVHGDIAERLVEVASDTLAHKLALVHGDVSPKNILMGPEGPVFLDAECAWFGDPAFDIAFCAAHLLLKSLWIEEHAPALLSAYAGLCDRYLGGVTWERVSDLDARAARLIAALLLARVDGKSPVEYLTDAREQDFVRGAARQLLIQPKPSLHAVGAAWRKQLERS
jgi:aminoglycoside phosphotransferase (APT) family kinase protein